MADQFDELVKILLLVEGGYSNDPMDSGGATKYGITEYEARSNGFEGNMRDIPEYFARMIYRNKYWVSPRYVEINIYSKAIAAELFDTAVNCGVQTAGKMLQRCLNVFNQEAKLYDDVAVDGIVGSSTIAVLKKYLNSRDEKVLLTALNCLQGARYIELAERRVKDERFIYGWIKNRI